MRSLRHNEVDISTFYMSLLASTSVFTFIGHVSASNHIKSSQPKVFPNLRMWQTIPCQCVVVCVYMCVCVCVCGIPQRKTLCARRALAYGCSVFTKSVLVQSVIFSCLNIHQGSFVSSCVCVLVCPCTHTLKHTSVPVCVLTSSCPDTCNCGSSLVSERP